MLRPATDEDIRTASASAISCGDAACRVDREDRRGLYDVDIFGVDRSGLGRWGHLELPVPVMHPWWKRLIGEVLSLDASELDDVVGHRAGWLDEDWGDWEALEYMPRDDDDDEPLDDQDIPISTGLRGLASLLESVAVEGEHAAALSRWGITPGDLMIRALPVLPVRFRGSIEQCTEAPIDHHYRAVAFHGATAARLVELDAPASPVVHCEQMVQASVDRLFDNRFAHDRVSTPAGDAIPDLGRILDAQHDDDSIRQVLLACRILADSQHAPEQRSVLP